MQYKLVNSLVVYYVIATIIQYIYCLKWLSYHSKHVTGRRFSGVTSSLFPVSALLDWPNEQQHRPRPQKRPPQLRVARARAREPTDDRALGTTRPNSSHYMTMNARPWMLLLVGWLVDGGAALLCNYCFDADMRADCWLNSRVCRENHVCFMDRKLIEYRSPIDGRDRLMTRHRMGCFHASLCHDQVRRVFVPGSSPGRIESGSDVFVLNRLL